MLKPGDVLTTRVPDGRFIAVRVLRVIGKSSLVSTTPYLANDPPALEDPLLREKVVQSRFSYGNTVAREWVNGMPPESFRLLGNIPPSKQEAEIECNVYGGRWRESTGSEAFLEWRWQHDRAAFEQEVRKKSEEAERNRRKPQNPKKMMAESEFWSIIDRLDWKCQGNDAKVLEPAVKALAARSKTSICQFEERLAFLLYQLDTRDHANNFDPEYVSADGFLYARCVVVANGRTRYEEVLKEPRKMPRDLEFESLLGLASSAYEKKTGEEFDYSTGYSYESFSNVIGWGGAQQS